MATKKTPPAIAGRRRLVASGRAQGKTNRAIAGETGIPLRSVERAATSPEVGQLIFDLVHADLGRIQRSFRKGLTAVDGSLTATKTALGTKGPKENRQSYSLGLGPDHFARLAGVKCLLAIITAGRAVVPPPDKTAQGRRLTLGEFREALKEHIPEYAALFDK